MTRATATSHQRAKDAARSEPPRPRAVIFPIGLIILFGVCLRAFWGVGLRALLFGRLGFPPLVGRSVVPGGVSPLVGLAGVFPLWAFGPGVGCPGLRDSGSPCRTPQRRDPSMEGAPGYGPGRRALNGAAAKCPARSMELLRNVPRAQWSCARRCWCEGIEIVYKNGAAHGDAMRSCADRGGAAPRRPADGNLCILFFVLRMGHCSSGQGWA